MPVSHTPETTVTSENRDEKKVPGVLEMLAQVPDLQRLDRFPGIGQKKAAMAVEILDRDLGVSIRELDGSDIAYDVHVRRVFLRTGLAEYDDLDHMIDVARRAYPERPGAIDMPAWLIGRQWCHAGLPDCPACVLRDVCPKDIDRANAVRGA
jgi:endonuclease III